MPRTLTVPPELERQMKLGAALVISISGGKDSQAMARAVSRLHRERGWSGPLLAVHADLGRIEWSGSAAQVEKIARESGLKLEIVRRRDGVGRWDMVDTWVERAETQLSKGQQARPWSDAKNRFCTSAMKREPINKLLRRFSRVVSCEGLRAQESPARAKKPAWSERARINNGVRAAFTWNPILDWTIDDVWAELGTSRRDLIRRQGLYKETRIAEALDGWNAHKVYVMGNQRLSCAFCVLACKGDLQNAAKHEPALFAELVSIEKKYGFNFQANRSLASLAPTA